MDKIPPNVPDVAKNAVVIRDNTLVFFKPNAKRVGDKLEQPKPMTAVQIKIRVNDE